MKKQQLFFALLLSILFFSSKVNAQTYVTIYEYYHFGANRHFYTNNYNELGAGSNGWTYNGILGSLLATGSVDQAVYRYHNPTTKAHLYTKSTTGYPGFVYESILGYEPASVHVPGVAVYQFHLSGNLYYSKNITPPPGGYVLDGMAFIGY